MLRYSKKFIGYRIVISIFTSAFLAFIFASPQEEYATWDNINLIIFGISFGIIFIVLSIYTYLFWRFSWYEFTEEAVVWYRGIIFKQKTVLPYNKIHAIDYKQNLIQRLFKIKVLSLDSGATTKANLVEISIVSDNEKIIELEKVLREKMTSNEGSTPIISSLSDEKEKSERQQIYKVTGKLKLLLALFNALIGVVSLIVAMILILAVITILNQGEYTFFRIVLFSLLGLGIFSAGTFLFCYLYASLRYYNYTITKSNDYLFIEYGIITKVTHSLKIDKIKAIKIDEGFIRRLFKMVKINLELVGYGDSKENQGGDNIFIPLCHKEMIDKYLSIFDDEFHNEEEINKAPKRSYQFFIGLSLLISSTVLLITFLSIFFLVYEVGTTYDVHIYSQLSLVTILFIFFMIVTLGTLRYKNSGITITDTKVIVHYGIINKQHMIIPNRNIISIQKLATHLRSKEGIASYIIHFYNAANKNTIMAHLLDDKLYDKLIQNLPL